MEQLIFQELRARLGYRNSNRALNYWRTVDQREVDFVIGDKLAIEVKATSQVAIRDLRGLRDIQDEHTFKTRIMVCQEPAPA